MIHFEWPWIFFLLPLPSLMDSIDVNFLHVLLELQDLPLHEILAAEYLVVLLLS